MNKAELERLHCDPHNWRLYFFYYCPCDPRILVPKRIRGLGLTLNFARPLAMPAFASMLFLAGWFVSLTRSANQHGGTVVLEFLVVVMFLALLYLCSRSARNNSNRAEDSNRGQTP